MRSTGEAVRKTTLVAALLVGSLLPGAAAAQFIYPSKGQSESQQQRDQSECHSWAVGQTGYNPGTAGQPTQGGLVRGGARGAATGAVIGAIAGDAGTGAAAGAAGGALIGGMRRRDAQRQQAAAQDAYQRAFFACLEGRGYTIR
jgi:hypothetical protein